MVKGGSIYILTNKPQGVLYTGVTSGLTARVMEHREKIDPKCFTARYNVSVLVYFENFADIEEAISREKQIKAGSRKDKIRLIAKLNPLWEDLWEKEVKYW